MKNPDNLARIVLGVLLLFCPLLAYTDVHQGTADCSGPVCDAIEECNFYNKRFDGNKPLFDYVVANSGDELVRLFCRYEEGLVMSQNDPSKIMPYSSNGITLSSLDNDYPIK
jgi:hypothetical protein